MDDETMEALIEYGLIYKSGKEYFVGLIEDSEVGIKKISENISEKRKKKIIKKSKCEWPKCRRKAICVTSTELTESGIIYLCDKHFQGLPT